MISEQRVQYLVEVLGADVGANAINKLGNALSASGRSAAQHAQELKSNARMAEVMQRSAERAAAAQRGMAQQFTATASAARSVTSAGLPLSVMTQRAAVGIGGMVTAAQGLSPALAGVGAAISRTSGSIGAFSQLFGGAAAGAGGGPWGIALGVAVTGLGLLSASFKTTAERAKESAEEMAGFIEEMKIMGEVAAEAERNSPAGIKRRQQEERVREERGRRGNTMRGLFDSSSSASPIGYGTGYDLGKDDEGNTFASKEAQREYIAKKEAEAGRTRAARKPAGRDLSEDAIARSREESIDLFRRSTPPNDALRVRRGDQAEGIGVSATAIQKQMASQQLDPFQDAFGKEAKLWEEREKAAQQYNETLTAGAQESWGSVGEAAGQAFAAIARGEKVSLKALLQGVGSDNIARGTTKLFEAAGWAFIPGGQATASGLAAVGAAQIAFGTTLAGVGAAAGGGKGASGGGGGGRSTSPTFFAEPSRETGAKNPQPIVINFPTQVSATHADGRRVQDSLEEMRRQGRA